MTVDLLGSEGFVAISNTQAVPYDDPKPFNAPVDHFLQTPVCKRDRIAYIMGSLEKMNTEMAK